MTIEPQGSMSLALESVRTTITACPAWHAWTGVDKRPEVERMTLAKRRTHLFGLPMPSEPESGGYTRDDLERLRPACVITLQPPEWLTRSGLGFRRSRTASEHFVDRGFVFAVFVANVDEAIASDPNAAMLDYVNRIGSLIDDMVEQGDVAGAAYLQEVALVVEPHHSAEVQAGFQGRFITSMLKIDWGLGG